MVFGDEIDGVPNKNSGGICIGNKIAPIFFNTMEDAGALVFEAPVEKINTGQIIKIFPYEGKITDESGEILSEFEMKSEVIFDEVQADGRINLIIGEASRREAESISGCPVGLLQGGRVTGRIGSWLHPCTENGWQSLWLGGCPTRYLLRTQDDDSGIPRYDRADDPR